MGRHDIIALDAMVAALDARRDRDDAMLEIVTHPERLVAALFKAAAAMPSEPVRGPKQHRNLTKAYRRAHGLLGKPGKGGAP